MRNIFPSEFVFDIILDCTDSSNGATDISNNTCDYYFNQGLYECGRLDDDDFSANEMCCACKGLFINNLISSTSESNLVSNAWSH